MGCRAGLVALAVWATFAVAGSRPKAKGGFGLMAAMLIGLGAPFDPPQRHVAEAKDQTPKGSPETSEPELDA